MKKEDLKKKKQLTREFITKARTSFLLIKAFNCFV